jgi:rRNA biogenesis protein RRP5
MPSTISKPRRTEDGDKSSKPAVEPRAMPTFVSTLKAEETDFPRGGGTSLTALEVKQTRDEGRREAEAEDRADVSFVSHVDELS